MSSYATAVDCKTHLNNASHTCRLSTGILQTHVRVYGKDLKELDSALAHQTALSPLDGELTWYFLCVRMGQRHLLEPGEELGWESSGLAEEFDLSRTAILSVHLAMNVFPVDPSYSLFWNSEEVTGWCQGEQLTLNFCRVHA